MARLRVDVTVTIEYGTTNANEARDCGENLMHAIKSAALLMYGPSGSEYAQLVGFAVMVKEGV
jgi:hypothetical protein